MPSLDPFKHCVFLLWGPVLSAFFLLAKYTPSKREPPAVTDGDQQPCWWDHPAPGVGLTHHGASGLRESLLTALTKCPQRNKEVMMSVSQQRVTGKKEEKGHFLNVLPSPSQSRPRPPPCEFSVNLCNTLLLLW